MGIADVQESWQSHSELDFPSWVRGVSASVLGSGLGISRAALVAGAQPAEIFAVLKLATMEDADLDMFREVRPPKTLWLAIADANRDALTQFMDVLKQEGSKLALPDLRAVLTPQSQVDSWTLVSGISEQSLSNMARIAEDYGALNDRGRKALRNFARMRATGRAFTLPQVQYLKGMLEELVRDGRVTRQTRDGNQSACDEVLNALGLP